MNVNVLMLRNIVDVLKCLIEPAVFVQLLKSLVVDIQVGHQYDFTTLYTNGTNRCQAHNGVSSRVLSQTLTCRVQIKILLTILVLHGRGIAPPDFEVSVLASSFLLTQVFLAASFPCAC